MSALRRATNALAKLAEFITSTVGAQFGKGTVAAAAAATATQLSLDEVVKALDRAQVFEGELTWLG